MMLKWLDAAEAARFGKELAAFVMDDLSGSVQKRDAKFAAKAEKVLVKAARRTEQFKAREALNFYKKSKLANAFLWTLKERGCPPAYADELTKWLTLRL
jgi:hypothetical protein